MGKSTRQQRRRSSNVIGAQVLASLVGEQHLATVLRYVADEDRHEDGSVSTMPLSLVRHKLGADMVDEGARFVVPAVGAKPMILISLEDLGAMLAARGPRRSLVEVMAPSDDLPAVGRLTIGPAKMGRLPSLTGR